MALARRLGDAHGELVVVGLVRGQRAGADVVREHGMRVGDGERGREQRVLFLGRARPRGDDVGHVDPHRRRPLDGAPVHVRLVPFDPALAARLLHVVQVQVEGGPGEGLGPGRAGRVEGDARALAELALEERANRRVEVAEHGVQSARGRDGMHGRHRTAPPRCANGQTNGPAACTVGQRRWR